MVSIHSNASLDKTILNKYMELEQPDNTCQVMYIWIDGSGENLRCKSRTLDAPPQKPEGRNP